MHIHAEKIAQFSRMVSKDYCSRDLVEYLEDDGIWVRSKYPSWDEGLSFRVAMGFIDNKPVFPGDKLYTKEGRCVTVVEFPTSGDLLIFKELSGHQKITDFFWDKPENSDKAKSTIAERSSAELIAELQAEVEELRAMVRQGDRKVAEVFNQRDEQLEQYIRILQAENARLKAKFPTIRHPTTKECFDAGRAFKEGGLLNTPEERERFESYMKGHCLSFAVYDEAIGAYDTIEARRLYDVWRDRGALPTVFADDNTVGNNVLERGYLPSLSLPETKLLLASINSVK